MSPPWEVVMKFKEKLKSAATANNARTGASAPPHVLSAVQHFLPSNGHTSSALRVKKVNDIINESAKVIAQSRPPALNSTVVNFCQNCACDNCANQSMLLGNDSEVCNTSVISAIVHSYEQFLEAQKSQFMTLLDHVASGINSSFTGVAFQKAVCSSVSSMEKQSAISESNYVQKAIDGVESQPSLSNTEVHDTFSPCSSNASTVNVEANECTSVSTAKQDKKKSEVLSSKDKSTIDKPENNENCNDSFGSFHGYRDESFRPVRKSSFVKLNECAVMIEPCDSQPNEEKKILKVQPKKHFTSSEKAKLLADLTLVYSDTVIPGKSSLKDQALSTKATHSRSPAKAKLLAVMPRDKVLPEAKTQKEQSLITETTRTRSGRGVQKPKSYWLNSSTTLKDNEPLRPIKEVSSNSKREKRPAYPEKPSSFKTTSKRRKRNDFDSTTEKGNEVDNSVEPKRKTKSKTALAIPNVLEATSKSKGASKTTSSNSSSDSKVRKARKVKSPVVSSTIRAKENVQCEPASKQISQNTTEALSSLDITRDALRETNKVTKKRKGNSPGASSSKVAKEDIKGKSASKQIPRRRGPRLQKKDISLHHIASSQRRQKMKLNTMALDLSSEGTMEPEFVCYLRDDVSNSSELFI